MSLVSMVYGQNFISIFCDGRATDKAGKIISESEKKFKVINDNLIISMTGSSALFDFLWAKISDLSKEYNSSQILRVIGEMISSIKKSEYNNYISLIGCYIDADGVKGIFQNSGEPLNAISAPKGNDINYFIAAPDEFDNDKAGKIFEHYFSDTGNIKLSQIKLNSYVASKSTSVNNNLQNYQWHR